MAKISSWLLAITGVIILSVLAEFILPDGKLNKYIKAIFSFVILLVIIMPLPKLLGKDYDISKWFNSNESVLQEDYLYQLNLDKVTALNKKISDRILQEGYKNVEVSINANVLTSNLEIFGVYVDLENLKFDEKVKDRSIGATKLKITEIIEENQILKGTKIRFSNE